MDAGKESKNTPPQGEPVLVSIVESRTTRSELIAALAAFIATLAILLGVSESCQNRKHRELAFRPILDFAFNLAPTSNPFGVIITNEGSGPAEIKWFQIYIDGKATPGDRPGWESVKKTLTMDEEWIRFYSFDPGNFIQDDTNFRIFGISHGETNETRISEFRLALKRLDFAICYCSLYNDCWYAQSRVVGPVARAKANDSCSSKTAYYERRTEN